MSCCLEKLERGDFALEENCGKNQYRLMGDGPKKRALEVRYGWLDYFVDISSSRKERLHQLILLSKPKQLDEYYCELKRHTRHKPEELKITRQWLQIRCREYRIPLKHRNKRFSIARAERKKRLIQFLKMCGLSDINEKLSTKWTLQFYQQIRYHYIAMNPVVRKHLTFLEGISHALLKKTTTCQERDVLWWP